MSLVRRFLVGVITTAALGCGASKPNGEPPASETLDGSQERRDGSSSTVTGTISDSSTGDSSAGPTGTEPIPPPLQPQPDGEALFEPLGLLRDLWLGGEHLYFKRRGGPPALMGVHRDGRAAPYDVGPLSSELGERVTTDDARVYYLYGGDIRFGAHGTEATATIALDGDLYSELRAHGDRLYFASQTCDRMGWVSKSGGSVDVATQSVADGGGFVTLFVDADHFYCSYLRTIYRRPTGGGEITTFTSEVTTAPVLSELDGELYGLDNQASLGQRDQHIKQFNRQDGTARELAVVETLGQTTSLHQDDSAKRWYWTGYGGLQIWRYDFGDATAELMLERRNWTQAEGDNDNQFYSMVVGDERYVYWIANGTVKRLPK